MELAPELADAQLARGYTLSNLRRYEEARQHFEAATRINPNLFDAYYYYGRAAFAAGDMEKAIELWNCAADVRREDFESPKFVEQTLRKLGRLEEARAANREAVRRVERIVELNPMNTRALSLGAEWAGGYDDTPPEPLDAAITFAPSGDVVRAALRATDRGATLAINAIHLDRLPEMPYEELWWERRLASVANFTRADALELLSLAAQIPVRTTFETHPLTDANLALARLARGEVDGAAVLVPG
jgi:tetratricopeptide (TPR) repeat protein